MKKESKYAVSIVMVKTVAGSWSCPNMLFVVTAESETEAREIAIQKAQDTNPTHEVQSILIQIVN